MESLDELIIIELKNFNFKRNSLAYEYLIEAIKLVVENTMVIGDFKKYVYGPVGIKYCTKPENVFWCINKLISLMYFNTDVKVIEMYFNTYMHNRPSTKAFIIAVARKVELQYDKSKFEQLEKII